MLKYLRRGRGIGRLMVSWQEVEWMVGSDDHNEGEKWDKYSETFDVNDKERQHKQQSSKKIIRVIAPSKLKIEDKDSEINAEIKGWEARIYLCAMSTL
jgi:hypothetical protein